MVSISQVCSDSKFFVFTKTYFDIPQLEKPCLLRFAGKIIKRKLLKVLNRLGPAATSFLKPLRSHTFQRLSIISITF